MLAKKTTSAFMQHRCPSWAAAVLLLAASLTPHCTFAVPSSEGEPQDYVALDGPIIVNIFTRDTVHFLRVTAEFKLSKPELASTLRTHLAAIRHDLILLMSEKRYFELTTAQGKVRLRQEALAAVQRIMKEQTGEPVVEEIYFTSLVLQ